MKKLLPYIYAILMLSACRNPGKIQEQATQAGDSTKETSNIRPEDSAFLGMLNEVPECLNFDKGLVYKIVPESLDIHHLSKLKSLNGLQSPNLQMLFCLRLLLADPNPDGTINLYKAVYFSEIGAKEAMANLRKLSGTVNGINDHAPGLSNANDYVLRSNNCIYWLNSGCNYTEEQHQKLIRQLQQQLKNRPMQESIFCNCGNPVCSY